MAECGCDVEFGLLDGVKTWRIEFCPTHAQAEAMAETLRDIAWFDVCRCLRVSRSDEPKKLSGDCSACKARAALPEAPDA